MLYVKLLLVEDKKDLLDLITLNLKMKGLEVVTASNGLEALELLDESVDAVLTDVKMPKMDGFQLLKQVKKINKSLRVYVMSANYVNLSKAKELGAAGFFKKASQGFNEAVYKIITKEVTDYF
ncbi:response regulator [archaeon]|nr:response regulator [archaeon]